MIVWLGIWVMGIEATNLRRWLLQVAADVLFPFSRLVVDPERFGRDEQEPMSECGMGVIYQATSDGRRLRGDLSNMERESLIETHYRPHHQLLSRAAREAIETEGRCLVLDGHSFPSFALPYERDKSLDRPGTCIGTDDYHTPAELRDTAVDLFRSAGFLCFAAAKAVAFISNFRSFSSVIFSSILVHV